jgi:hypothetical protein
VGWVVRLSVCGVVWVRGGFRPILILNNRLGHIRRVLQNAYTKTPNSESELDMGLEKGDITGQEERGLTKGHVQLTTP